MSTPELGTVEVLAAATALRWSRPDLAAALAEHLMEAASARSDPDRWLVAAGWRVQAMCATGDGREVAADVLETLPRWGADMLSRGAADRLRLELAVLAHDAGEPDASRALLDGISTGGPAADTELAADVATARLRCGRDDGPLDPTDALAAWGRVGGPAGDVGAATVLLVTASTDRRIDRAEQAVTRSVDGLGRLDRARTSVQALSPSPHLAAALAAEWISALIAAGRPDQAREGSSPLRERLVEQARPTRQLALLRLTLARAAAVHAQDGADAVNELERAAHDAAASDAPELEYICRTALGEVHEAAGRLEAALESVRLAVVAERRHRSRAVRFRAALAATAGLEPSDPAVELRSGAGAGRTGAAGGGVPAGSTERTAILRSVQAASMAEPRPVGEPVGRDTARTSSNHPGRPNVSPSGIGRAPSNGSTVNGAASSGSGSTGPAPSRANGSGTHDVVAGGESAAGVRGPWTILPGPQVGRVNGNGSHREGSVGGRPTNGHASRRGEPGSGAERSGTHRSGPENERRNGRTTHGSGWDLLAPRAAADPRTGERDSMPTAPVNPWATGAWTAGTPPVRERPADTAGPPVPTAPELPVAPHSSTAGGPPVAPPDPVASALADPEAWLASALADLDRIWGRRPDGADDQARDDQARDDQGRDDQARDDQARDDPPRDGPARADQARADQARADQARADQARADQARADQARAEPIPLLAEGPPSGCVVVLDLARGGERLPAADAAPTVRRVARRLAQRLPESAQLRRDGADTVSVVLVDGDRAAAAEWMHRVVPALVDGLAVDAAVQGAHLRAAVHDTQGVVGAQVLQRLDGGRSRAARGGTPGRARHSALGDPSAAPAADEATGAAQRGSDDRVGGTRHRTMSSITGDGVADGVGAGAGVPGGAVDDDALRVSGAPTSPAPGRAAPVGADDAAVTAAAPSSPVADRPTADDAVVGRHDEASGRRPYLPDGVVVRPGTGGRRHRRSADPTPEDAEPGTRAPAASAGPQSTEGLGLADLLAGALAAYRGI